MIRAYLYRLYKLKNTIKILKNTYGYQGLFRAIGNRLHGYDLLWNLEDTPKDSDTPKLHVKKKEIFQKGVHISLPDIDEIQKLVQNECGDFSDIEKKTILPCSRRLNPSPAHCKARILLFSHELSRTGAPGVLLEAAKLLMQEGYFLELAAPYFSDGSRMEMAEDFVSFGIPVFLDTSTLNFRYFPTTIIPDHAFPFMEKLASFQQLIFFNSYISVNVMATLCRKNLPILFWLHEGIETYRQTAYFPRHLPKATHILCVGGYAKRIMEQYKIRCHADMLLYGLPDRAEAYTAKPSEKVRFMLVGTVDPRKDQLLFVKAFQLLPMELQQKAEFIIVGGHFKKAYFEQVKSAAEKLPQGRLLPSMPSNEVFELYREADCVVVPSIDDPMPVVATEGFMLSKIVIVSDMTGSAYYIKDGENGFVFPSGNAEALAQKLQKVIESKSSPEMDRLKQNGRKIYEAYFTPEVFRKNLLGYVESAIRS